MSPDKKAIGARLRAVREAPPRWSRPEMARQLRAAAHPLDRPGLPHVASLADMIKQWERGQWIPNPQYRALYAAATGRQEAELFGQEPSPPRSTPPQAAPLAPFASPGADGAGGDYAAAVRDTNRQLIVLDSRYGGTAIVHLADHAFRAARDALATGRHDADETELQAAAGETGEIAAWTLYDADRLPESRSTTHEALLLSRLAGDRSMELFELSHLALLDVHQRNSREAFRIADHTIDGGNLAPRVEALFKIRAARALAQGGDRARSLRRLHEATSALQESLHPRDPYWTWWLDSSELAWHRGILHMELGELETAMPFLDRAAHGRLDRDPYLPATAAGPVTARGQEWGRAAYNDLVHLLLALTMAQAWQETEAIMATVNDFSREVVSARTEVMLRSAVRTVMAARLRPGVGAAPSSTLADLAEDVSRRRGWPLPDP